MKEIKYIYRSPPSFMQKGHWLHKASSHLAYISAPSQSEKLITKNKVHMYTYVHKIKSKNYKHAHIK